MYVVIYSSIDYLIVTQTTIPSSSFLVFAILHEIHDGFVFPRSQYTVGLFARFLSFTLVILDGFGFFTLYTGHHLFFQLTRLQRV